MWFELHPSLIPALAVLASLCLVPRPAEAQAVAPTPVAAQAAPDLRVLVARIALYPDDVLSLQLLPASTAALDVVEATRHLDKHQADQVPRPRPDWDPSVLALLNYPEGVAADGFRPRLDQPARPGGGRRHERRARRHPGHPVRGGGCRLPGHQRQGRGHPRAGQPVTIRSTDPDIAYVPVYESTTVVNQTYAAAPPLAYANPYLELPVARSALLRGAAVRHRDRLRPELGRRRHRHRCP